MKKVLMLGWEFPPFFSGGLGVATYGIVKALSKKAFIRLIVPAASVNTDLANVNVIGLNKITSEEIDLERAAAVHEEINTTITSIPVALSPYHFTNEVIMQSEVKSTTFETSKEVSKPISHINTIFADKEVYGRNIFFKVNLFTKLVTEIAADGDFDVIHAHDWVTWPAGVSLKIKTGKPLVLHVHALETDRAGNTTRNEIYELEKAALQEADKIITVSQYTKDELIAHYEINEQRVVVVHNGIEQVALHRQQHKLREKIVLFLGRLTHQKGPFFLLETAEKLSRVVPGVKFVVAGTGDQFAQLLETSAYKRLGRKFIFTGFLPKNKVNELLAMADVYFMPSVSEPFGLTALEAAQAGVPGVISSQSGAAEVMRSSLQADFWDTDKFANYIYALLHYDALHTEIASQAKQNLVKLTWQQTADKITDVYNSLSSN